MAFAIPTSQRLARTSSACATQAQQIDQQYGTGAGSVNAQLMRGSGTSESAAIVSGAVALLLSQRPSLTPDQAKATLKVHAT